MTSGLSQDNQLKEAIRKIVLDIYEDCGLTAARDRVSSMILLCEDRRYDARTRATLKGELSETVLEIHLREFSKIVKPCVIVKGLCIPTINGSGATTEMDLCMFTPYRIYMFECKSYGGKKTVTKECYLKGGSTEHDIYRQSITHMQVLNQYLQPYRRNTIFKGNAPYKLFLFEFSSNDLTDLRADEWVKKIPALTLGNVREVLAQEFTTQMKVNWDVDGMLPIISRLNRNSEKMFEVHMKRILALNEKKKSSGKER